MGQKVITIFNRALEPLCRPCCFKPVRDSLGESSMIASRHEQLDPYEVQDHELVGLQCCVEAAQIADDLV